MVEEGQQPRTWLHGRLGLPLGSVISLAAVALALQATLPQIAPAFQLIGHSADRGVRPPMPSFWAAC